MALTRRELLTGLLGGAALAAIAPRARAAPAHAPTVPRRPLDLSRAEDNLTAFVKTRASLHVEDVLFWWSGTIHSFVPGQSSAALFGFEGFNVMRALPIDGGYQLLSREMSVYRDPGSGKILERWLNPALGREVEVLPVWNDPVDHKLMLHDWSLPHLESEDDVVFNMDVFLRYPSPLPRAAYPLYSASDIYEAAELFQFFVSRRALEDPALASVPARISWTRLGPWLPWMEMGDRPGHLVYHAAGKKLGWEQLPADLRAYVETHQPRFRHAPTELQQPNETSWTYFKKQLLKRAK